MQPGNTRPMSGQGSDGRNRNGRGIANQNRLLFAALIKAFKELTLDL